MRVTNLCHQVLHWILASHLKMRIGYWLTFSLWSYSETYSEPFQLALMWLLFPIILIFFILEYRYFKQALNPLIVYIRIYDLQIRLVALSFIKLANRIV